MKFHCRSDKLVLETVGGEDDLTERPALLNLLEGANAWVAVTAIKRIVANKLNFAIVVL